MPSFEEKAQHLVMKLAGEFISRESNRTSLITVTGALIRDRGREALVLVTVLPDDQSEIALEFLKRKRSEFREYLKKRAKFATVPIVDFAIDRGEKHRQRIEEISKNI